MKSIAVLGLGTIGIKLVEYLADKGFRIIAYNARNIEQKEKSFLGNIEKKVRYDKISMESIEPIKARVRFTEDLVECKSADMIIECIKEDYETKAVMFRMLSGLDIGHEKIIATTTSSLSLERLIAESGIRDIVGLHFFNPPTRMRLVEISYPAEFSDSKRNHLQEILNRLDDKLIVEMPIVQGYIVNRILFAYINFAIEFMRVNGFAPDTVDAAMKAGTNVPMGPLELSDYIGNDITFQILKAFANEIQDSRYIPDPTLVELVSSNKLGRKSGEGFYNYRKDR